MRLIEDRKRADYILDEFWGGVSETFNNGPLKNLESFDILYAQSPKAMSKFMDTQMSLSSEMTFEELELSIKKMAEAFKVIVLRYKNLVKQERTDSVQVPDPFATQTVLVSTEKEDPFA